MRITKRWFSVGMLGLLIGAGAQAQLETVWQMSLFPTSMHMLMLLPDGSGMISSTGLHSGDHRRAQTWLWQLPTGNLLCTFPLPVPGQHALSADGELLLTANYGAFFVWRLSDRTIAYQVPIPRLGQSTTLLLAFLTPDGERIIASLYGCDYDEYGDCNNSIYAIVCLQISTGEVIWERVEENGGFYNLLALSPDGRWLIVSGYEVEVLNAQNGSLLYEWDEMADSAAFSPDSQVVALGVGRDIALYRMTDGVLIRRFSTSHQYRMSGLDFSPDGRYLVSTDRESARVWNWTDGSLVRSWRSASYSIYHAIFFGNDLLLTAGSERITDSLYAGSIRLWRLSDGALLRIWTSHAYPMTQLTFSADGGQLATAGTDGRILLWDAADGRVLQQLAAQPVERYVYALHFAPDGNTLASGGQDGLLRLWDVRRGGFPAFFLAHPEGITSLQYSPDGSLIVSGGYDRLVKLWNATNRMLVRTLSGHFGGVTSLSFAPDGSLIASASFDGTIRLWQTATGALVRVLSGHRGVVWTVVFSPDGQHLFSGGADGTVRTWNVSTGSLLRTWLAHPNGVYQVVLSPTGHLLASRGEDNTLRFWNARTGTLLFIHTLPNDYYPAALTFSPNPSYFAYVAQYYRYPADSTVVVTRVRIAGDIDGDGCVDDADLLRVLFAFGQSGSDLPEDISGDGIVDDADLLMVLFNFGSGC